jgi:hypothetical protein
MNELLKTSRLYNCAIEEVMSNLAIKQATYQDIIDLPENIVGEIINGQLETHPRPAPDLVS